MKSLSVFTFFLIVTASGVQAGLSDQTFTWVDLSAGVAATVGICVFFAGIGFMIYELGFREYLAEVRVNGKPFAQELPDPPAAPTMEDKDVLFTPEVEKVEIDIDLGDEDGVIDKDELAIYDGLADAVAEAATPL